MKIHPAANQISFHQLHTLFEDATSDVMILKPAAGMGTVHFFSLEKGLQARLWDCSFTSGLEMYCDEAAAIKEPYFTLAFFLNKEKLVFSNNNLFFRQNIIWDTLFISSSSSLRMYVPPAASVVCLNISFSKQWLQQHILCDIGFEQLDKTLFSTPACSVLEYMDDAAKKLLYEMIAVPARKENALFYMKAGVLKMVSDFFHKLKTKVTSGNNCSRMSELLTKTEALLCENVTGAFPSVKGLALEYGFSEVSLKRHFKQRYTVNMSTYFMLKKMEYAKMLMHETNNIVDTAHKLGYKNVNHFKSLFNKVTGTAALNTAMPALNNNNPYSQAV